MENKKGYFLDDSGNKSVTRLMCFWAFLIGSFLAIISFIIVIIIILSIVLFNKDINLVSIIASFSMFSIGIISLFFGYSGATKVGSRFGENFKGGNNGNSSTYPSN